MERNDRNRGRRRRKVCAFCADKVETIDYKDVARLRRYLSERAKIVPRRVTGTCAASSERTDRGYQESSSHRSAALCS